MNDAKIESFVQKKITLESDFENDKRTVGDKLN